ncbi:NADH:ubiquinone oxidoreductase subunit E [Streptomyces sp. SAI-229]
MAFIRSARTFDAFRALADRRGRPGDRLIESLAEARDGTSDSPESWAPAVASRTGLPAAAALGPASYYADLSAPHGDRHVRVCTATACFAAGGGGHLAEVERVLGVAAHTASPRGDVSVQTVRCLGYCYAGPAALDGDTPCTGATLPAQLAGREPPRAPEIPAVDDTGDPVLLGGVLSGEPAWRVWPGTVSSGTPEEVRREVAASGLRGRGGAGFRVAAKWEAAGRAPGTVVVANGDEGDPGSYADRLLMEADPGRVLEGLALACFASGARRGVVLVRSEYPAALARMREAVRRAYADGHLGPSVHGTATSLDIHVVQGAGSYVAGEETALIAGLDALAAAVERDLLHPWQRALQRRPVQPEPRPRHEQGGLGGVTQRAPLRGAVRQRLQRRVVAQHGDAQQRHQIGCVVGRDRPPVADDPAPGLVTGSQDRGLSPRRPQPFGGHAALGQGAGLVGGDHRDGAQRLHRGQPADDGVPVRHPPCPQGERERHDGGQGLRYGGDREADRRHDHQLHGLSARQPESQHQGAQCHDDGCQNPAEIRQPALQRGRTGRGTHQGRDPAERAVDSRGGDRDASAAVHDDRARRHRAVRGGTAGRLLHRNGLARQRGLVRQQRGSGQDVPVGGHDVALGHQDHVPGHHLGGREGAFLAVPYDSGGGGAHGGQGHHRLFGPYLLYDADRGVHRDDEQDHGGIGEITGGDRQGGGHQQHQDQRISQLLQHPPPHGGARLLRDRVGPMTRQPARGLGRRQTRRGRSGRCRTGCAGARVGTPGAPLLAHAPDGVLDARAPRTARRSPPRTARTPGRVGARASGPACSLCAIHRTPVMRVTAFPDANARCRGAAADTGRR